jgi:hypothetical protein
MVYYIYKLFIHRYMYNILLSMKFGMHWSQGGNFILDEPFFAFYFIDLYNKTLMGLFSVCSHPPAIRGPFVLCT